MISSFRSLDRVISNIKNNRNIFEGTFKKTDEEFFVDMMTQKLSHKFSVLKMMAKNHEVEVDVDKLMSDVMTEVHRQVDKKIGKPVADKITKLVYINLSEDIIVESNENFKKNFKLWCEDFVNTINFLKKDFSWIDAKAIVKKVACLGV